MRRIVSIWFGLALLAPAAHALDESGLRALLADPRGPARIDLEPRTYHGDFAIARPVALVGHGATIEGSGTGTVLDVRADDVSIEDLTVRSSGRRHTHEDAAIKARGHRIRVVGVLIRDALFGIVMEECKACLVENAHVIGLGGEGQLRGDGIKLWEADDSAVRGTVVEQARDTVVWYSKRVVLEEDRFVGNRYGAHFMYAHDGEVRRCRFERNVVGVFVMYSWRVKVSGSTLAGARGAAGMGIGFKDSDDVEVTDSSIVADTTGVYLDRTPRSPDHPAKIHDDLIALCSVAIRIHGAQSGVVVAGDDFQGNHSPAEVEGGGDAGGVDFHENFWSDYEGYDLDGDGFGDVPFEVKRLASDVTSAHPAVQYFRGTAALGLMDTVSRAVPMFSSRTLLRDPRPRFSPRRSLP